MIIQASAVSMQAERSYQKVESAISETVISKADEAIKLDISDKSKSLLAQMQEKKKEKEQNRKEEEAEKKNQGMSLEFAQRISSEKSEMSQFKIQTKEDFELEMLRRFLESLRKEKGGGNRILKGLEDRFRALEEQKMQAGGSFELSIGKSLGSMSLSTGAVKNVVNVGGRAGTVMKIQTVTSSFFHEQEATEFSTTGMVRTADGRELSFGLSVEMSRSFTQATESYAEGSYILKDPLVINLDSDIADVKDMKFFFDIDADGKEEEISQLGSNSGFLALDKNGDGVINDGSELFGTKSGDGFGDLAAYDHDHNGWIDEADDVFSKLKIWVKDEDGSNRLLDLKEAGIGAIYLGNADTKFSLNQAETNATNAVIQKTGIYLKENGTVGTVQHVDLAL